MTRRYTHADLLALANQLARGAGPEVAQEFDRILSRVQPVGSTRGRIERKRNARAIGAAAREAAEALDVANGEAESGMREVIAAGLAALARLAGSPATDATLAAAYALRTGAETLASAGDKLLPAEGRAIYALRGARLIGEAEGLLTGVEARTHDTSKPKRKRAAPRREAAIEKVLTSQRSGMSGAVLSRLTGVSERQARRALAEIKSRP